MAGLGKGYDGLNGNALLARLVDNREVKVLEALWRVHNPDLCQILTTRLPALDEPLLNDLLAEEVLHPVIGVTLASTICQAIGLHPGRLPAARAQELIDALRAPSALSHPTYQQSRARFEIWALVQPGHLADDLALDVAALATPMSSVGEVRGAAFARASKDLLLAKRMALRLLEGLRTNGRPEDWSVAADYVESTGGQQQSTEFLDLVRELVFRAPELSGEQAFRPNLQRQGGKHATAQLIERLEGQALGQDPGSEALVRLVESVAPKNRKRLFVATLRQQLALRQVVLSLAGAWSEEEWLVRLEALRALPSGTTIPGLESLLIQAPATLSPSVIELAAWCGASANGQLTNAAISVAQRHVNSLRDDDWGQGLVAVYPWPDPADVDVVSITRTVLDQTLQQKMTQRAGVLAAAYMSEKASPATVAALLRDGTTGQLLDAPVLGGSQIRDLVPALHDARPSETAAEIRNRQTQLFSLDLCAGLANDGPGAAFTGATDGYDRLDGGQRDELLGLLENHANAEQLLVFEKFMDPAPAGRARRERALVAVGKLLTPRTSVPPYFSEALRHTHAPIREAALNAIAQARPRDRDLVGTLRDAGSNGGPTAAPARRTLDVLVADFLGDSQISDGINVHQAAASALADLARHHPQFTPEQINRLGGLLDGEKSEVDGQARHSLEEAFANASIGDQSFVVLKDLLGGYAFGDPDALFAPAQKVKLSRAISLYKNEQSRGEAGWPGLIQQLDIASEQLMRAAYLVFGDSDKMKAMILEEELNKPDLGSLITALQGNLKSAQSHLQILHDLRSKNTEYSHPGQKPTREDVAQAELHFREGAKVLVGELKQASATHTK